MKDMEIEVSSSPKNIGNLPLIRSAVYPMSGCRIFPTKVVTVAIRAAFMGSKRDITR